MYPPDLFFPVALQRAVLQADTQSLRGAPVKVRRELVEAWNGLKKIIVLFPAVDLIDALCKYM